MICPSKPLNQRMIPMPKIHTIDRETARINRETARINSEMLRINRLALAEIDRQIYDLFVAFRFDKRNPGDTAGASAGKIAIERIQKGRFSAVSRGFLNVARALLAARAALIGGMAAPYVYESDDWLSQDRVDADAHYREESRKQSDWEKQVFRKMDEALALTSPRTKAGKPKAPAQRRKRPASLSPQKANRSARKAMAA
jgi:hypothetical protein